VSRTVFLHVGVAKTGTTYLQRLLSTNRDLLRDHGVLYPGERPNAHFLASMDLREAGFGGYHYPGAPGMWQKLVAEAKRFPHATVISHETLARARPNTIAKAVADFDTGDVRVVVTARDLGRQIPAVWQETVKNRNVQTYSQFLEAVFEATAADGTTKLNSFWRPQDVPRLVRRWLESVGDGNVIVVTVPPAGADRQELWRRFATALELPDLPYSFDTGVGNASLGTVQSELLRRMNRHIPEQVEWATYERRVKREFVERRLSSLPSSDRIAVPDRWREQVGVVADRMTRELAQLPIRVIGDLDDLRPQLTEPAGPLPDDISDTQLLKAALGVLADLAVAPGAAPRPAQPQPPSPPQSQPPSDISRVERLKQKLQP
jgi:hypothetical protein